MKNIYVANLPYSSDDAELRGLFEEYGTVDKATVIKDRDTGRSRGFGFVGFLIEFGQGHAAETDGGDLDVGGT